ncbi:peptidylprolyl isomerase [Candidatus Woesearchaeota archaeon]|nr:peptidylprolyl isomerase [Candidatus Woesearchaeota archaeon]
MSGEIKQGDFVAIDYTGRIKETGMVFDTTVAEVARSSGMDEGQYGEVVVCIGEGQMLKGIEKELVGKTVGKYHFDLSPEDGFGKKNPKLLQLLSGARFREQQIVPAPGMQVNIDGMYGIVKAVSGGRVIVDFNHPLAGKELQYDVEAKRVILDSKEKLDYLLRFFFKDFSASVSDGVASVELKGGIPEQLKEKIAQDIKRLLPEIKDVEIKPAQ